VSKNDFKGPYDIDSTVIPANRAAVYLIVSMSNNGNKHVIDVGESGEIGIRIGAHDRRPCWERHRNGGALYAYLLYMPRSEGYTAEDRRKVEQEMRIRYNPPCGKR